MSALFINGSPNKNGNTARLAREVLKRTDYKTLSLVDYKVYSYGQKFADDQFEEVLSEMRKADTIVIGSPLYWHNICGTVRNLLDRFYGPVEYNSFVGKKLVFLFQGAAPEKWMLEAGEYTMSRFAQLYGMTYVGMATNAKEAKQLAKEI